MSAQTMPQRRVEVFAAILIHMIGAAAFCSGVRAGFSDFARGESPHQITSASQVPPTSQGPDYYVAPQGKDSNDGSKRHPWATISHAGSVAGPGARVHVAPGTYNENVVTTASGTPSARIVYISDDRWRAAIAPTAASTFVWKNTGDYTDIIGFEIAGEQCDGIGLGGSSQTAQSNNIHNTAAHCNEPGKNGTNGGSAIVSFVYTARDNDIYGNFVHDIGISDPLCGQSGHNLVHGIYQSTPGGHIHHNIVVDVCGFGITLWHGATHASITNNTVVACRLGGIEVGSGDAPCTTTGCPGGNDYTIVRNNISAYNGNSVTGGWGILEVEQSPGKVGPHNQYTHNLSFGNPTGDFRRIQCANCITGADPMFISLSARDFHLQKNSPAISAGTRQDFIAIDFEGNTASAVDLGALSFGGRRPERDPAGAIGADAGKP